MPRARYGKSSVSGDREEEIRPREKNSAKKHNTVGYSVDDVSNHMIITVLRDTGEMPDGMK
jgi:hypothetical protein